MSHSKEIKGEWFGVSIPQWLHVFDCRQSPDKGIVAPYKIEDEVEKVLGLKADGKSHTNVPHFCTCYGNLLNCSESELKRQIISALHIADGLRLEYERAVAPPTDKGGHACYLPLAITFNNYAWSILADRRVYRLQAFIQGDKQ